MDPNLRIAASALTLRPLGPGDAAKLFRMSQEPALRKWIPSQVYRDLAEAEGVLAFLISQYREGADPRNSPLVLGIELAATGELIGHVGLSPFRGGAEIGFAIEDAHKRKGHATAAVGAMCGWAMKEFSLERISGYVARENEASRSVLLRAGFRLVREETMPFQGTVQPVVVFELTRP